MSQIAYSGGDGLIYTADPEGAARDPVTAPGVVCYWPTWSPDGSRIAFSRFRSGSNGGGRLETCVRVLEEVQDRTVHTNDGGTDAIARGTPHYFLWSPDSRRLAFIAQAHSVGLGLFVQDVHGSGDPARLVEGGPLFISWSPDSRYLLAHFGQDHRLVDFYSDTDARQLPGAATLYMAPSWSPVANQMAMFRDSGGEGQTLFIADVDSGDARALTDIIGRGAFRWSPDGRSIGLVKDSDPQTGYFSGLWLLDSTGGAEERVTDDSVLCFFWSPNGERIAYITPSNETEGSVRWVVLHVATGVASHLVTFRPTQEQLNILTFFDQYGQSHTPWSPAGDRLIFSGDVEHREAGTGRSTHDHSAKVYVADVASVDNVEGKTEPVPIGGGTMGTWRPI